MTMFDFKTSLPPNAAPLQESSVANDFEDELKQVFGDLFSLMGKDTFDASVLGSAHLGSFDLVRKAVNRDGLVLLSGEREEAATRYLYRAWKSGDVQKRGLHFLRTYLQMLFPGDADVKQLWHTNGERYGSAFIKNEPRSPYWHGFLGLGSADLKLDGSWKVGKPIISPDGSLPEHLPDINKIFLTSRVEILLGLENIADAVTGNINGDSSVTTGLIQVIRSVVPARLVPSFKFWLRFIIAVSILTSSKMLMQKNSRMRYPWCGRVITDQTDAKWKLGRDGEFVKLGAKFGTFKLGEKRGGFSSWKLKACRIESSIDAQLYSETIVPPIPKLGQKWLKLNGAWALGKPQFNALSVMSMDKKVVIDQPVKLETTFHEYIEMNFPGTPARLGRHNVLSRYLKLDGGWSVGRSTQKLDGFKLRRSKIDTVMSGDFYINGDAVAYPEDGFERLRLNSAATQGLGSRKSSGLTGAESFKIASNEPLGDELPLLLNGSWQVGSRRAAPDFSMNITRL